MRTDNIDDVIQNLYEITEKDHKMWENMMAELTSLRIIVADIGLPREESKWLYQSVRNMDTILTEWRNDDGI